MTGQSTQTSLHEPLRPAIPSSVVARRHPDRSTNWVIVVLVHMNPLRTPAVGVLQERLDRASGTFPLIASRLRDDWWVPSTGPAVIVVPQGTDPFAPAHLARFALDHEPPVRVFTPTSGEWLLFFGRCSPAKRLCRRTTPQSARPAARPRMPSVAYVGRPIPSPRRTPSLPRNRLWPGPPSSRVAASRPDSPQPALGPRWRIMPHVASR
jgi:hypothetical protein